MAELLRWQQHRSSQEQSLEARVAALEASICSVRAFCDVDGPWRPVALSDLVAGTDGEVVARDLDLRSVLGWGRGSHLIP
jgi:hypothetical protein